MVCWFTNNYLNSLVMLESSHSYQDYDLVKQDQDYELVKRAGVVLW